MPDSNAFRALLSAYRSSGGTARGDGLSQMLQQHRHEGYVDLARLLVSGGAFGFQWRGILWIPMFQFNATDLSIRSELRLILDRSGGVSDGWQIARWFAAQNARLDGRRPADVFDTDLLSVLDAARSDRFIAAGPA